MVADLVMESDPDIGRSRVSLVCRLIELISGENSHKKVTKFCNVTFLIASHCCNSASVQLIEIILLSLCRALWRILRAKMENLAG